jgi:hypothetical protein
MLSICPEPLLKNSVCASLRAHGIYYRCPVRTLAPNSPVLAQHLVRQPHLVIFEALSLVVALFRSCLVDPSPGGPVVGVVARVDGVAQGGPEAPDFVAGQGNQVLDAACGAPF